MPGTRTRGLIELKGDPDAFTGQRVVIKNAYAILGKMKNTADDE